MTVAAVAGIGETPIGRLPGTTSLGLHAAAAQSALDDAGVAWGEVDGLITCGSFVDSWPRHSMVAAEYLGVLDQLTYTATMSYGGASSAIALLHAVWAVERGDCANVLVVGADNQRTGQSREAAVATYSAFRHPRFEGPAGLTNPASYALLARRHSALYGTTPSQLATTAVVMRSWASRNPAATYRDPITVDDVLASPFIAEPLRQLECSPISDGGGAMLVRAASGADARDVRVLGHGFASLYDHVSQSAAIPRTGAAEAGRRAFAKANLTPSDVDVAMLYDSYSIAVLVQLEELGFCDIGEGGAFVESGGIEPGTGLAINTHGGLLSHGHPGAPAGIFHLTEAVRQLRGTVADGRQVPDAAIALVHAEGGIQSANVTLLLGRG